MYSVKLRIFWFLLLGILIFLGLNRHSKDKFNNYHSVVWADAAGYSAYLPFFFSDYFENASQNEIDSITSSTGNGFKVENGKMITKYSFGVSLFEWPAYAISIMIDSDKAPFNPLFQRLVIVLAALYGWLSLYLFASSLGRLQIENSWLYALVLLLATNVYYYVIDNSGMSHVYSFFTVNLLLWSLIRLKENGRFILLIFISIFVLLAIRPVNLIFVPFLVLIGLHLSKVSIQEFVNTAFQKGNIWFILLAAVLFAFPQLYYWNDAFGSPLAYSYGDESFENILSPRIVAVFFSTNNGLFLYNPIWLVFVGVLMCQLFDKERFYLSLKTILLFGVLTFVFASWWSWHFGCGFGHRAYVEFTAPIAMIAFYSLRNMSLIKQIWFFLPFVLFNLKLIYSFDECWLEGDWEYQIFLDTLVTSKTR